MSNDSSEIQNRLARLPERLDAVFEGFEARLGARLDELSAQIEAMETEVWEGFTSVGNRLAAISIQGEGLEAGLDGLVSRLNEILGRVTDAPNRMS